MEPINSTSFGFTTWPKTTKKKKKKVNISNNGQITATSDNKGQ
jgi:hypothetical protein